MKTTHFSKRFLKFYARLLTLFLFTFAFFSCQNKEKDEITVKRINVVNEDGTPAVIISNRDRIPPPVLDGQEFKRAVTASGIINYNADGNERGGIAVADNENLAMTAMVLDYMTMDAIGMISSEDLETNKFSAILTVNDPDKDRRIGYGTNRMTLGTKNGNAGLIINSPDGKPRVIIEVDTLDEVSFYVLDAKGNIIKDLLDQGTKEH